MIRQRYADNPISKLNNTFINGFVGVVKSAFYAATMVGDKLGIRLSPKTRRFQENYRDARFAKQAKTAIQLAEEQVRKINSSLGGTAPQ